MLEIGNEKNWICFRKYNAHMLNLESITYHKSTMYLFQMSTEYI